MPKVLPEYLEHRRRQILEAASACFSRQGFHRTTVQDVCREADLSPGAVYRYFSSKEEIIEAIGEESRQRDIGRIEAIKASGDTLDILAGLAREFFLNLDPETACVDIDLWAESTRNPDVRDIFVKGLNAVRDSLAEFTRRAQKRGEFNPSLDPEAVASAFIALFHGLILQKQLDPDMDVAKYAHVALALAGGDFWRGRPLAAAPDS